MSSLPKVSCPPLSQNPVQILHPKISEVLDKLSTDDQRAIAQALEDFIKVISGHGGTQELISLGILEPQNVNEPEEVKGNVLDTCYWQLAKVYKVSSTTSGWVIL